MIKKLFFIAIVVLLSAYLYLSKSDSYQYKFTQDSVYELEFQQESLLMKSSFIPKDMLYEYKVDALLNMKILEKNKNYVWTAIELSSFFLEGVGINQLILDRLTPYYESMFLVKFALNGEILDVKFPGKSENFAGLLQLIYSLEIINLEKKSYKTKERDSTGSYEAFYKKDLTTIQKQKSKYINVTNPNNNYSAKVEDSFTQAQIDTKKSWLKELNLNERITLIDENKNQFAKNTNRIYLLKTDESIDKTLQIYKENRDIKILLEEFEVLQKKDINIFEKISNETLKDKFIKTNTTLEKLDNKINEKSSLMEIKKYIELFPSETYKLKKIILESDDIKAMRLIAILPMINTKESQNLLVELAIDEEIKHRDKIRSIIALGDIIQPSDKTIEQLMQISDSKGDVLSDDKADTALLTLSIYVKYKEKKDIIKNYLASEYQSVSSLSKEKNLLLSMQNAGAENFLDEIENSLNSKSIKVKNLAIKTIATIKDKNLRNKILNEQLQKQDNEQTIKLINELLK